MFETSIYNLILAEQLANTNTYTPCHVWNGGSDSGSIASPDDADPGQIIDFNEAVPARAFCDRLNVSADSQRCAGYPFGSGAQPTASSVRIPERSPVTRIDATSASGGIALAAGNDVNLHAGQENHSAFQNTKTHSGGLFSSTTTTTHDAVQDSVAVGTQLSGSHVSLAAGHDLNAQAAYLNADNALTLAADHDIHRTDAHDRHSEQHDTETKSFSFFSTSSKRFGSVDPEWRSNASSTQILQTSSVGNVLSGDSVTVAAGNTLSATNAQIVATNDVVLAAGHNLSLNAGQNTY